MDGAAWPGTLMRVPAAIGTVICPHRGPRPGRRGLLVDRVLQRQRLATLILPMAGGDAADGRAHPADLAALDERLTQALDWLHAHAEVGHLPVGLFGAGTTGAASLRVAARRPARVAAVVVRAARMDLAVEQLPQVQAATLLIVGGRDTQALAQTRHAVMLLRGPRRLEVVPGADHRFDGPGALETVADLAADWFAVHLRDGRSA